MADKIIKLKNVRISFPHIFKAKDYNDNGDFKYQAALILDMANEDHTKLQKGLLKLIKKMAYAKWGDKIKIKPEKLFLRDGDDNEKVQDGYEGNWFINASNKKRFVVVDKDGRTPLAEDDDKCMGGDYVNANINIWLQDNKYGKRVNANLVGVQFVSEGERFGAQMPTAEEQFDALEFDDDDPFGDDDDGDMFD